MKEYRLVDKGNLTLTDRIIDMDENSLKIHLEKAAISRFDIRQFTGEAGQFGFVPLRHAMGIVSDSQASALFSRGDRVYLNSYIACDNCYFCKTAQPRLCPNMIRMGVNADGFLTEFIKLKEPSLIALPDNVTDEQALFIDQISTAVSIIDHIDLEKGDHVVIFGSNIISNILCQLALYYQAIPILVDNNELNIEIAKKCGVYYIINNDSVAQKQIREITGGRMASKLVYFASSKFTPKGIFSTCSYGAKAVLTGLTHNEVPINYQEALEKQLHIDYVSNGYENNPTSISLLVNKAVNIQYFIKNQVSFADVTSCFEQRTHESIDESLIYDTIVNF